VDGVDRLAGLEDLFLCDDGLDIEFRRGLGHCVEDLTFFFARRVADVQLQHEAVDLGFRTREEERKILDAMATTSPKLDVEAVISKEEILEARKAVDAIHVADPIRDYIVSLVLATRGQHPGGPDLAKFLQFGASPRATINLTLAAKAWAFLQGRDHVTPQDVKDIAPDVLRHRLILTYEADAEGVDADAIVRRVLDAVSVP